MSVCTGTRVPAKTGVPLKRSGDVVIRGSRTAIFISYPPPLGTRPATLQRIPPPLGTLPHPRLASPKRPGEIPGSDRRPWHFSAAVFEQRSGFFVLTLWRD